LSALPPTLSSAFELAAQELGMLSASRLFLRELSDHGGNDVVRDARDDLGAEYPVFDHAAARWLDGASRESIDAAPVIEALQGIQWLLVVGLEADHLDVLIEQLGDIEIGILRHSVGNPRDWRRVLANFRGRVSEVRLGDIHLWAGGKSAVLTDILGRPMDVYPRWFLEADAADFTTIVS